MVVVLSKYRVADGMVEAVRASFAGRPHPVDGAPGFLRMEVLSPRDRPEEFWLMPYGADEEGYRTRHRSHAYEESHQGIPKGLKLVPQSAEIRLFEHVAD